MSAPNNITGLLVAWSNGDRTALDTLTLLERELDRLAARYMAGERPGPVLPTRALVNEAYLRLVDWKQGPWQNRAHRIGEIYRRALDLPPNDRLEFLDLACADDPDLPHEFEPLLAGMIRLGSFMPHQQWMRLLRGLHVRRHTCRL